MCFSNLADHGMDPQEAIDHPRLFWGDDGVLEAESGMPESVRWRARREGPSRRAMRNVRYGGAQMIVIDRAERFPDRRIGSAQGRRGDRVVRVS